MYLPGVRPEFLLIGLEMLGYGPEPDHFKLNSL
jgi:hypothetical protein